MLYNVTCDTSIIYFYVIFFFKGTYQTWTSSSLVNLVATSFNPILQGQQPGHPATDLDAFTILQSGVNATGCEYRIESNDTFMLNWTTSEAQCQYEGGHMADITSVAEQLFIQNILVRIAPGNLLPNYVSISMMRARYLFPPAVINQRPYHRPYPPSFLSVPLYFSSSVLLVFCRSNFFLLYF